MSKCPFWSSTTNKVECNKDCPMFVDGAENTLSEKCIFNECTSTIDVNFKETIKETVKEDYSFLNLHLYDDEKTICY